MIDIDPKDLPRYRAIFALEKVSSTVQSDMLADDDFSRRIDIPVSQPVRLSEQIVIDRTLLFTVFQKAADGQQLPPLVDDEGRPLNLTITFVSDTAVVVSSGQRWQFMHAALLSSEPSRRLAILSNYISQNTLTEAEHSRLQQLLRQQEFSHRDFITADALLSSSPESFVAALRAKAALGAVTLGDLLPNQAAHWYHLTAVPVRSGTIDEFIGNELTAERRARIARNPVHAVAMMALNFGSPALIPHELLKDIGADPLLAGIEQIEKFDDPFALCGAFDICIDRAAVDPRFMEAGRRLLDKLFSDMDQLNMAADLFGAIFVIATAYLADHETLRQRPVYWRRLAAASHAALIARALGVPKSAEPLLTWAMGIRGQTYFLSVSNEFSDHPRWRPDWIVPRFLVADIFGRALASLRRFSGGDVPAIWRERLDPAETWIKENKLFALIYFPAVLEGARWAQIPSLQDLSSVTDAYQKLIDKPSLAALLLLTAPIEALGFPREAIGAIFNVVQSLRSETTGLDEPVIQAALALAAGIAVHLCDEGLADLVADVSIELSAGTARLKSIGEVVFRIVECAGAYKDRDKAMAALAERLEQLAFVVQRPALNNLLSLLAALRRLDDKLATQLGRAIAAARLGSVGKNAA